ncbi:hypothetical protein F5887DRAFT_1097334 [Amanita rubescens]|nr:hypothetical protein F5887DRAFT_1097334 [Amanita rubescens]
MSQLHTSNSKSTGLSTTSPSHAPYLTGTPSATPNGTHAKPKPKPMNVFTNDGSFLDRFQRQKKGEEDKSKQEEIMNRKKNFEDRFKNRGKRIRTDESENTSPSETSPTSPVSSTAGR